MQRPRRDAREATAVCREHGVAFMINNCMLFDKLPGGIAAEFDGVESQGNGEHSVEEKGVATPMARMTYLVVLCYLVR